MNENQDQTTPTTNSRIIGYWTATVIVALVMLSGGVACVMNYSGNVEGIVNQLGYPLYFLTILGFWKIMGGCALLLPNFPRLQDWAYAGVVFELTSAIASHVAVGDSISKFIAPVIFIALTVVSWRLRPSQPELKTASNEAP